MSPSKNRLEELLKDSELNQGLYAKVGDEQYGRGNIPCHYKRMTVKDVGKYTRLGTRKLLLYFGAELYFTQALIAGVVLSRDYTKVGIISPSQYGKSLLMGMISVALAYDGMKVNIAAATEDKTDIIMRYARRSISGSRDEIKNALSAEQIKKIDRLDQSVSKTRLSFAGRGSIQGLTLGDTFAGITHNKAVGQSGGYIVDEAALISPEALSEIGRREFSTVDSSKYPLIMISNPHNPGYFYDFMTKEDLREDECVIWMDALTAVQEGRWTKDLVMNSDFAEYTDTLERYLLCELPAQGVGMFGDVVVSDDIPSGTRVMGVDAAWKGKDNIEVCTGYRYRTASFP